MCLGLIDYLEKRSYLKRLNLVVTQNFERKSIKILFQTVKKACVTHAPLECHVLFDWPLIIYGVKQPEYNTLF